MQVIHTSIDSHAKQLEGQVMQEPLDKYLPVAQVEHDYFVDEEHVKQLFVE